MARSMQAAMQTAIAAEASSIIHLVEIHSSASVDTLLTTAPHDISWDSETWSGIGGALSFDVIQETTDQRAQGVRLELSGVDQTIISLLLSYHMRGRQAVVYLAHLSDGDIVADPIEIFRGYLNADWEIEEERSDEGGTCRISTQVVSRLAALEFASPVRANITSHREMLRRAGLTGNLTDNFFRFLPKLVGQAIYWGTQHSSAGTAGGGHWDEERN